MNYLYHQKNRARKNSSKTPYWNFWRVVFAGWLIQYPRPFFVAIGFILVMIYSAVTK
jgi:hypothetical protein